MSGNNLKLEINPTGCSPFETYWYEIILKVTDPGGLTAKDAKMIFPDCDGLLEELPEAGDKEFILLPNPANYFAEIRSAQSFEGSLPYLVYTTDGRKVYEGIQPVYNNRNFVRIDISALRSGIYILHFKIGENWHQAKLVKSE